MRIIPYNRSVSVVRDATKPTSSDYIDRQVMYTMHVGVGKQAQARAHERSSDILL